MLQELIISHFLEKSTYYRIGMIKAKIVGYAIWVLILMLGISAIRNFGRITRVRSEIAKERERVESMKRKNEELAKRLAETQSVEFVEAEIRNKLGLVKEGETVVILPDEETLRKLAPNLLSEPETLPDPNWRRWLKLFF